MSIASVSKSRVAFIAETVINTIPEDPTFQTFRRTSGGLGTRKSTVQSDEIQPDRNVRDVYQTGQDGQGTYEAEFSHATFDELLAGAMMSSWAANVLSNGVTEKSFAFEEMVSVDGNSLMSRHTGVMVNTFQLTAQARQPVRASIGLMSRQETLATEILSGATYTAPNTEPIETGVSVTIGGVFGLNPLPICRGVTLNINNNLRTNDQLGSLYSAEFGMGSCDITGSIELYFNSNAQYQLVLDHASGAISFTLGSQANKKYTFSMPVARVLDGAKTLRGKNDSVMATLPFQARGTAAQPSLSITRLVA